MHDDDDAAVMTMMTPKQDASAYDGESIPMLMVDGNGSCDT